MHDTLDDTLKGWESVGVLVPRQPDSLESRLKDLRISVVYTLSILAKFPEGRVEAKAIAAKVSYHRSAVHAFLRELEAIGLASRTIKPGSENRFKPTFFYSIDPSVDSIQLEYLLGKYDFTKRRRPKPSAGSVKQRSPKPNTVSELGFLLKQMAEEVAALKSRVSSLESFGDSLAEATRILKS
jgi:hypothetical protein